jgi:hypothetical protein
LPARSKTSTVASSGGASTVSEACTFQYFTGEEFFQHAFAHERSDLIHRRGRLDAKLELLSAESLRIAHPAGALRSKDLASGHSRHRRSASDRRPWPTADFEKWWREDDVGGVTDALR